MSDLFEAFKRQFPDRDLVQGPGKSCNVPAGKGEGVHYGLIWREGYPSFIGNHFYVEFHVESSAEERDLLVKRLKQVFSPRIFFHFTHYNTNCWQTRTPVFTEDDVARDVEAIKDVVEPVLKETTKSQLDKDQEPPSVGIRQETLQDLLSRKLSIPDYQRAYCWRKINILDLLEEIKGWMANHRDDDSCYHLGTVILKENTVTKTLDIIDGQQRLTTLAMLKAIRVIQSGSNETINIPLLSNFNDQIEASKKRLLRARETLKAWLSWNEGINIDYGRIQFSVVILGKETSDDLAHTFFSNTNSAGKRLSDYDLLKTHHLRYISNESTAMIRVERWHKVEKDGQQAELLHQLLYRLRNWRSGTKIYLAADETQERHLFRHYAVSIDPVDGVSACRMPVRFDSILSGGIEFFDYVEQYRKRFAEFSSHDVVKKLKETFEWHNKGRLYLGMKALAFLFYCRFGDAYLREAVYCIAYRVSSLRTEPKITKFYPANPLFQECTACLDRVTSEEDFFAWALDSKQAYVVVIDSEKKGEVWNYWVALRGFLAAEEKDKTRFALSPVTKSNEIPIESEGDK